MQKPNFGGANFYSLSKPVAVKIEGAFIPTAMADADLTKQGLTSLSAQSTETRPVVIITGRGRTAGRVPTLVRLQPDVVNEIKRLVDGPHYLTIELALRRYAKDLRTRKACSVEMIKAADLGWTLDNLRGVRRFQRMAA